MKKLFFTILIATIATLTATAQDNNGQTAIPKKSDILLPDTTLTYIVRDSALLMDIYYPGDSVSTTFDGIFTKMI